MYAGMQESRCLALDLLCPTFGDLAKCNIPYYITKKLSKKLICYPLNRGVAVVTTAVFLSDNDKVDLSLSTFKMVWNMALIISTNVNYNRYMAAT